MAQDPMQALLDQRRVLVTRVGEEQERLEQLRQIVVELEQQLDYDERVLGEIDAVLGRDPQMRLEDANLRLRGRRLEEVALRVLSEEREAGSEVHYREWFELLRERGHLVAGKAPLNTFLAQINRSVAVERVGKRSGRYRLAA
jgi:Tfp pilus assembly protein PilN